MLLACDLEVLTNNVNKFQITAPTVTAHSHAEDIGPLTRISKLGRATLWTSVRAEQCLCSESQHQHLCICNHLISKFRPQTWLSWALLEAIALVSSFVKSRGHITLFLVAPYIMMFPDYLSNVPPLTHQQMAQFSSSPIDSLQKEKGPSIRVLIWVQKLGNNLHFGKITEIRATHALFSQSWIELAKQSWLLRAGLSVINGKHFNIVPEVRGMLVHFWTESCLLLIFVSSKWILRKS